MNNLNEPTSNQKMENISNNLNSLVDMNALVINLKNEDSRNLRLMKNFKWMYFFLIIVYSLIFIVNPDPDLNLHRRISGLFIVLSFTAFALIFRKYHKEYREIDYSAPLSVMLSDAVKRYKMSVKNFLILIPPIALMDIGLTFSFYNDLTSMEPINRILVIQAVFIPIMVISGFIGYLIWRERQKPLHDGALQMLKDLNE